MAPSGPRGPKEDQGGPREPYNSLRNLNIVFIKWNYLNLMKGEYLFIIEKKNLNIIQKKYLNIMKKKEISEYYKREITI